MSNVARLDETVEPDRTGHETRSGFRSLRRRNLVARSLIALLIVAGIIGLVMLLFSGRYVSTQNAFVQVDKIFLSAEVAGRAIAVDAHTNQEVAAGDVLFRIDDRAYRIAVTQAEADVAAKRNEIEALKASYEEGLAGIATAEENIAFAEREFERQQALVKRGAASQAKLDQVRHDLNLAKTRYDEIKEELAVIRARLGGDPRLPVDRNPEVLKTLAALEQARLDLTHTTIVAPEDATVAAVSLQPGEFVQVGKPVLSLVAKSGLWVTANFKETELTHVRVGQHAKISVDLYPGREWDAKVGSISPATGAEFALIPPQNASGNWVKVIQRIPVRLYLDDYSGDPPLQAGLSVHVEIDTERKTGLLSLFSG